MKNVYVIAFAIFFVSSFAVATVNFSGECKDGKLIISYESDAGERPSGIALKIELGGAVFHYPPQDPIVTAEAFNTYVDYAYSNPLNFAVGDGHPLAKADTAGALEEAASVFSICAGVLDESGNQIPGPESARFIEIPISGGSGEDIVISGDTLRGPQSGVVGQEGPLESNLPIVVEGCGCECPCGIEEHIPYAKDYLDAGYDISCWCCPYNCRGDCYCDLHILGYRVYTTDLDCVAKSWKAKIGDPNLNPCADFARDKHILGYRVYTTDLGILAENWKKKDAELETCW